MIEGLLRGRVDITFAALKQSMDRELYADGPTAKPISRTRRFKNWLSVRSERIKDAWLVLTGKASIGY